MNRREFIKIWGVAFAIASASILSGAELPPPCDPVPVKKPVKVVRRKIKVSIIGADRPTGPADVSRTRRSSLTARAT